MITSSSSVCGIVTSEISVLGSVVFVLGFEGFSSESSFSFLEDLLFGLTSSSLTSSLTKDFFLSTFFSSGFFSTTFFLGSVSCVGSVSIFSCLSVLGLSFVSCVTSSSIVCSGWSPFVTGQPSSSGSSSFRGNWFDYIFWKKWKLLQAFF